MADLKKTIEVTLAGTDKGLSKTLRAANKSLDEFSGNVQDVTGPLADIGRKAAMTEAALISMAVAGLAYAGKKAADFDSSFREITTLVDETGQGMLDFRSDILNYATDSSKSIQDINAAVYSAISAGVDYKDSLASLSDAERLAVGTKADLGSSLKALVSVMNAYGAESDEAGKYAEIFFETVQQGQTTMPELAQKIANVTSIAANSGVSFAELSAAIAAVTSTGLPTSEAITGLKQTVSNIIKPTSQAADMAEKLGIQFNAQALEAKGLKGILDVVKEKTGGSTSQMTKLFGSVEALNIVMALTGEGAIKFADTLEKTEETTGSLTTAYGKMADDVKLKTQELINNIDVTLIDIGDRVLSSFEGIPEAGKELLQGFRDVIDQGAFDTIFEGLDDFAEEFKNTLQEVAKNAPEALMNIDFTGLMDAFRDLGNEVKTVFDFMLGDKIDLSTVEGLENGIQRLVNLFQGLTEFTKGFLEGIEPMAKAIGLIGEKAGSAAGQGAELAGKIAGLSQTVNIAFQAFDALKGVLTGFFSLLFVEKIAAWTMGLGKLATASSSAIGSAAGYAGLLGLSAAAGYAVGTLINKYVPGVSSAAEKTWEWVDSIISFTGKQEAAEKAAGSFDRAVASWIQNINKYSTDLGWLRKDLKGLGYDVEGMSNEVVLEVSADEGILEIKDLMRIKREAASEIEKPMEMKVDAASTETVGETWARTIKALDDVWVGTKEGIDANPIEPDVDTEKASNEIDKLAEKKLEVEADIKMAEIDKDIAQIKAVADTVQTKMEWEAKVDIAQAEASVRKVEAALNSANVAIESTGQSIGDAMSALADDSLDTFARWDIEDYFEAEADRRAQAFEQQRKLLEQQVKLNDLKIDRMESGEPMMNISVDDSVEPALKLVLMNILELMQTEFNESANEFLLGWESVA